MRLASPILATLMLALPAVAADPAYIDDRSTPQAVITSYYNAINRHEYARAWSYYQDGEGIDPYDQFVNGYAKTASVTVKFGAVAQEGAAGSTYWTLPVALDATSTGGAHSYFTGCYTLRLANPAIQAEPPFRPLHIVEGNLKSARKADAPPATCPA